MPFEGVGSDPVVITSSASLGTVPTVFHPSSRSLALAAFCLLRCSPWISRLSWFFRASCCCLELLALSRADQTFFAAGHSVPWTFVLP